MSAHVLAAAAPVRLGELLTTALSVHPDLRARDGVCLESFWSELDTHTRARVHSDKLPWNHDRDWVEDLVEGGMRSAIARNSPGRALWRIRHPDRARALSGLLSDAMVAVFLADGRHELAACTQATDPEAAAVAAGRRWAQSHHHLHSLPPNILVLTDGMRPTQSILAALSLGRHPPTEEMLSLLDRLPSPSRPPKLDAAFCAWPPAAALLKSMNLPVSPRASAHPAALAARATHAAAEGEAAQAKALAEDALATGATAAARAEAIDALLEINEVERAIAHLQRWRRATNAPEAWTRLMGLHDHSVSFELAPFARSHRDGVVRGALARWLVRHGLDQQAAEVTARVRSLDWHQAP